MFTCLVSDRVVCRGKTLGGSSSINGADWTRGLATQYDAFSELLEPEEASVGWNWGNLFSYMKKVVLIFPFMRRGVFDTNCRPRASLRPILNNARRARIQLRHIMARMVLYRLRTRTQCSEARNRRPLSTLWSTSQELHVPRISTVAIPTASQSCL